MLTPATKQEISAGLWIHNVNKCTEGIRAFEGNRAWPPKPGPAEPRLLAETPAQAVRRPRGLGPRESVSALNPEDSYVPDPGCEFVTHGTSEGRKLTRTATSLGNRAENAEVCSDLYRTLCPVISITTCVP